MNLKEFYCKFPRLRSYAYYNILMFGETDSQIQRLYPQFLQIEDFVTGSTMYHFIVWVPHFRRRTTTHRRFSKCRTANTTPKQENSPSDRVSTAAKSNTAASSRSSFVNQSLHMSLPICFPAGRELRCTKLPTEDVHSHVNRSDTNNVSPLHQHQNRRRSYLTHFELFSPSTWPNKKDLSKNVTKIYTDGKTKR